MYTTRMTKRARYFVENTTDPEHTYFVGTDDHGYNTLADAEKAKARLEALYADEVYTIYVRGIQWR